MALMRLTVLGATGSIGVSTLDVVARHPDRFEVVALTGHRQINVLADQCRQFSPRYAVVGTAEGAVALRDRLAALGVTAFPEILHGQKALEQVAALPDVDAVMAAIVGAAGLGPTLAAARAGKRVLLANKEALVMAGPVFMAEVEKSGAVLLPIDSEHNAVFQSLPHNYSGVQIGAGRQGVRRIVLTASGGPFRTRTPESLIDVTPEQAVAHPNWSMGQKISVDSASMMNKGLEVIEAHWLFGVPADRIDVVIHPQSVIHSMVDYDDGSVLAQLGNPDMRTPIAHALAWPERVDSGVASLNLCDIGRLEFEPPDLARFPCLALAYQALRQEGNAPAVLNAANEVAVEAFLQRQLAFPHIASVIRSALESVPTSDLPDLAAVMAADNAGRDAARLALARFGR